MVQAPPKSDLPDYDGGGAGGASPAEDRFARLRWCKHLWCELCRRLICPTTMAQLLMVQAPPNTGLPDYDGAIADGASPAEDRFTRLRWCKPRRTPICPTTMVQLLMVQAPPWTDLPDYDVASADGASPAEDRFARLRWCNCRWCEPRRGPICPTVMV